MVKPQPDRPRDNIKGQIIDFKSQIVENQKDQSNLGIEDQKHSSRILHPNISRLTRKGVMRNYFSSNQKPMTQKTPILAVTKESKDKIDFK